MNYKSVSDLLDHVPQSNKHVASVYFGDFDNLSNYGSTIILNKDIFSKCIKHVQGLLKQKYDNSSLRIYQYRDLYLNIDHANNKTYTMKKHISTMCHKNTCVSIQDIREISKECFPIIDKYSSVCDQKIKTLSSDSVKVHFIEQLNKGEENLLFIRIDFINKNTEARKVCENIINKIILYK